MLEGSPGISLFLFALPLILGNLFQQFYNMVDSITVGKFVGEQALASVGASYAVNNVFIAVAIGGGIGSSVIISQCYGAQQIGKVKTGVATALINFTALGAVLGLFGALFCGQILTALRTPPDVYAGAYTYLMITFWGLPFLFLYNVESSVFNSLGDSVTPLLLLIFSSLLNIVLDLVFVIVLGLGVAGVAYATLIAQGLSAVLSFLLLRRKVDSLVSEGGEPLYSGALSLRMLKVAVPSILQQGIVNVGMLLVQSVVNSFGSQALAGYTAAMRYEAIGIVPMIAVGNAVSTFTAQNMGAGKVGRIKRGYRASLVMDVFFAAVICLILQLFGKGLITLFLDAGAGGAAFETGLSYVHFISFFFVFIGLKMSTDGLLRGAGDVGMFTVANLVNLGIRVWFSFRFAPVIGIQAVWMAVPVGWLANFVLSFLWYRTGRWARKVLV